MEGRMTHTLDKTIAPLESLAAEWLRRAGAPVTTPGDGTELGDLRRWCLDREYGDRVAAGVALGCFYLRSYIPKIKGIESCAYYQEAAYYSAIAHVIEETAKLSEWGAVLRLLEHGGAVEVEHLEEIFPDTLRGLEMRPGRRKGAYSPLKQWILDYLTRNPTAINDDILRRLRYDEPRAGTIETKDKSQTGLTFDGEPIPKKRLRERANECRELLGIK